MKKRTILIAIISIILASITVEAATSYAYYKKMVKRQKIGVIREYYSENLTAEILENRGDDIVIEKIIGTVTNKKKDGRIYGADQGHNYISYRRVKGARKGDTILTICIYTPGNSYTDDICERFDYIVDRSK